MDKIAVLIPCYNESQTEAKVIADFKKELPEAVIYVYDNNSTDATAETAANVGAIVRKETKQGKGNVIRSMFRYIDAECYVMVDGDDTYSASKVREMVHAVLHDRMDMVIGDRLSGRYFVENKRPLHNFGNKMVRYLINTIFKSNVRDVMTGYRALGYHFVKTFHVLSTGFEIETEMTIHCLDKNLYLKSVPVDYKDRIAGSVSKLNTYTDGIKVLKTIFYLYRDYQPLSFFKWTSVVLFIAGAGLLYPVLRDYLHSGLVPRFPTFILSCSVVGLKGYPALDLLKWLVSIFTACMFTFFILWVQRRWGWATAFFVLITICFSQWVTVFGRNLFWILGAFYLPWIFALWYLQKYESNAANPLRTTFWFMFCTMLFKCLFTGFEYITTALVMSVTPCFFYAMENQWNWKKFLKNVTVASAGALVAVVACMAILTRQLSVVAGSLSEGLKYILISFSRRSYGSFGEFDSFFKESVDSNLWNVLKAYWNENAIDLSHWFDNPLWQSVAKVNFGFCVWLFLAITAIIFLSKNCDYIPDSGDNR